MFRRTTAVLLVTAMLCVSQVGCLGRNALGKKVLGFNLRVADGKWGRWGVFLLLNIIPVYPIAALLDLLIVNSIEFHRGTNPVSDEPRLAIREGREEVVAADGSRAVSRLNEDGSVTIDMIDAQGAEHTVFLVPVPGGVEARDADGKFIGHVDAEGRLRMAEGIVPPGWGG